MYNEKQRDVHDKPSNYSRALLYVRAGVEGGIYFVYYSTLSLTKKISQKMKGLRDLHENEIHSDKVARHPCLIIDMFYVVPYDTNLYRLGRESVYYS